MRDDGTGSTYLKSIPSRYIASLAKELKRSIAKSDRLRATGNLQVLKQPKANLAQNLLPVRVSQMIPTIVCAITLPFNKGHMSTSQWGLILGPNRRKAL